MRRKARLTFDIEKDNFEALQRIAKDQGRSVSSLMRRLIRAFIEGERYEEL